MWGEVCKTGRPVVFCTSKDFIKHSFAFMADKTREVHFDISSPTNKTYSHACVLNAFSKLNNTFSFRNKPTEQTSLHINDYESGRTLKPIKASRVLLAPRLDMSFKPLKMQSASKNIPAVREHWKNFINQQNYDLRIDMPLWMFDPSISEYFDGETEFLVPHREKKQWGKGNYLFYMQTVFPWLFTVDKEGWGSSGSYMGSFDPLKPASNHAFKVLKRYIQDGNSKFDQPREGFYSLDPYIAIPLQIPHDEVVIQHSNVSCEDFVIKLCEWKDKNPLAPKLVFKGHPINLMSMKPLKEIIDRCGGAEYVEHCNIHSLIELAEATFVINSGTGQEAMLLNSTVVCFGDAEYEGAVIKGDIHNITKTWNRVLVDDKQKREEIYQRWYDWYINGVTYATNR